LSRARSTFGGTPPLAIKGGTAQNSFISSTPDDCRGKRKGTARMHKNKIIFMLKNGLNETPENVVTMTSLLLYVLFILIISKDTERNIPLCYLEGFCEIVYP
jgi:hypothetical protein